MEAKRRSGIRLEGALIGKVRCNMHRLVRIIATFTFIAATLLVAGLRAGPVQAGTAQNYLVLYKGNAVTASAITAAGGTLVYAYNQIGVAVASSSSATFAADVARDNRVEGAAATAGFATRLDQDTADAGPLPDSAPATDSDSLSSLQWDMVQMHTPEAHAITGGSPSIVVGDIDTGLDYTHPDLAANVDSARSVNCESGVPVPGAVAANDDNGHGTHTAGTIAAASNGIGIVGVAPNVKIAGIKAGNAAGFFFPEAVICSFMWVATHNFDVTNNSYFADPYLFNCKNDPTQRAIWKAESRAIEFAESKGVTVVAAMGNESEDLAHPTVDATSPDNTTPETRDVTNACVVIPVEVPGVIGVSATGSTQQTDGNSSPDYLKSFYSSLGVGVTQVAAPGGDSVYRTAASVNGRVLSTYPPSQPCTRKVVDQGATYCYLQGTSMASPHAVGVAALIISVFGHMPPGKVKAYLTQTADPQPCPTALPLVPLDYTAVGVGAGTQTKKFYPCQGGPGNNSWYGSGQ